VISDPFGMMRLMPFGMVGFFAALGLVLASICFLPPLRRARRRRGGTRVVASLPFALDCTSSCCRRTIPLATRPGGDLVGVPRGDAQTLQGIIAPGSTPGRASSRLEPTTPS